MGRVWVTLALGDRLQLARLILELLRPGAPGRPDPGLREERGEAQGARYDLYAPRGAPRSSLVVLHGGDRAGWQNPRLTGLARALARCGVACLVPELDGLARGALDPADLDAIAAVGARAELRPGLLGFGFGAGYALTAACREDLGPRVRFVVGVGAFHDLGGLLDGYLEWQRTAPGTAAEWDDAIYVRALVAWWFREELGLAPELVRALDRLLTRFCEEATAAEKRAFFDAHLAGLDVFGIAARTADRARLARLSPKGRVGALRLPVTLVHDRYDALVPLREAERLAAELPGHPAPVVTGLLAHPTPAQALDLAALGRLTRALSPLVSAS